MSKRPSEVRDEGPEGKIARTDDVVAGVVKKIGTWYEILSLCVSDFHTVSDFDILLVM